MVVAKGHVAVDVGVVELDNEVTVALAVEGGVVAGGEVDSSVLENEADVVFGAVVTPDDGAEVR
ncbi:MAG TPA: hypothetical protein VEC02_07170 [Nitrososphaerales archaeon]|nr:hypothetical protein [Nitrososphaerales archaeon]